MQKVEEGTKKYKGLFLGGNYKTGVAFGDCVQYGADIAAVVSEELKSDTVVPEIVSSETSDVTVKEVLV